MKKIEIALWILTILSILLRFSNIIGSNMIFILSLTLLAMLYYLSFALLNNIRLRDIFKSSAYKETNARRIIGTVGLGFAFSAVVMGGLFKLQLWPGGSIQLLTGLIFTGIIAIISLIFYSTKRLKFFKGIFIRIALIGGFGLTIYFTPESKLVDIYYRDNPEYAELYKKVLADPDNHELKAQLDQMMDEMYENEYRNRIDEDQ